MRKIALAFAAATMTVPVIMPAPALAHDEVYRGQTWRGSDGRLHCRKRDGTVGMIVGGAAGALAGRAIDNRGERTTGTILGAVAGVLVGREIDRNRGRRCR
jgi:outer membrane lipoprotein SlyB